MEITKKSYFDPKKSALGHSILHYCNVIVRYLAEISQLMHLTISSRLHMLMITCQTQCESALKKVYACFLK